MVTPVLVPVEAESSTATGAPDETVTIGSVDVGDPHGFPGGIAGIVSQNGNITVVSDNLTILQPVGAGTAFVFLAQRTAADTIDLGGADAAGVLGLSNADLSHVNAAGLAVGRGDGGSITVTAPIMLVTTSPNPGLGVGTLVLGILVPLLLHVRVGSRQPWSVPAAAVCVLLGGLLLRYGMVTTPGEMLARGPGLVDRFAPEQGRRVGQSGADIGNRGAAVEPRSKLPVEP